MTDEELTAMAGSCRASTPPPAPSREHRAAVEALRATERPYLFALAAEGRAHDAMVKGGPRAGGVA